MKTYLATINIILEAESEEDASDGLWATLQKAYHDRYIIDWAYTRDSSGIYSLPKEVDLPNTEYHSDDYIAEVADGLMGKTN
jgi:hypothetical protein